MAIVKILSTDVKLVSSINYNHFANILIERYS